MVPSRSQITPEPALCRRGLLVRMWTVERRSNSPTSPMLMSIFTLPLGHGYFQSGEFATPHNSHRDSFSHRFGKQRPDALRPVDNLSIELKEYVANQQPCFTAGR